MLSWLHLNLWITWRWALVAVSLTKPRGSRRGADSEVCGDPESLPALSSRLPSSIPGEEDFKSKFRGLEWVSARSSRKQKIWKTPGYPFQQRIL